MITGAICLGILPRWLKLDKACRVVEYDLVMMRIFRKFIKLFLVLLMAVAPLQFAHATGSATCAGMGKPVYQQGGSVVVSDAVLSGDSKLLVDGLQQNCRTSHNHNCASCAPCAVAPLTMGTAFDARGARALLAIRQNHAAYLSPSLRPPISRS